MPVINTPTNPAPLSPFHSGPLATSPHPFGAYSAAGLPTAPPGPTVGGLLNALKRRWVLATFLGLFVAVTATTVTLFSMPSGKHLARAVLKTTRPPNASDDNYRAAKESLFQKLRSRNLVNMVVTDVGESRLTMLQDVDDKQRAVEEGIDARWVGEETLRVSMTGDNKEELKLILDTLAKDLDKTLVSEDDHRRSKRLGLVKDKKGKLERDLKELQTDLRTNAQGPAGVVSSIDGSQSQLMTFQKIQADLEQRISEYEVRLETIKLQKTDLDNVLSKETPHIPPEMLGASAVAGAAFFVEKSSQVVPVEVTQRLIALHPPVRQAADNLAQKQEAFHKAQGTFDPASPFYKNAEKAVRTAEKELDDAKARALPAVEAAARADYRRSLVIARNDLNNDENLTTTQKRAAENRLTEVGGKVATMMARVVENQFANDKLKPLYDQLARIKAEQNELETVTNDAKVEQIDETVVYENQNLKQRIIAGTVAGLAGLAGVLFLIAFLEWRTRRIDSVDQVMNDLGMRVIGTIPAFPSKAAVKAGSVDANQSWRFILNESVNSTRTLLLHTAKAQSMQVIMVTSAMQGEGKTSLASQLATSMATAGLRTLILDCDMRNPSVHRLFDVALSPGCSEILCQEVDVADAVQPTAVPNLWMIAGGHCSNRVVAALAQGQPLEALFNRLRGQFDFVVVDCCPVLPVADALLIGQHVDGVVFSILQDISQLPKVLDASKRLTSLNIPLLGAVVNGTKVDTYTYGYNYVKQLPA
jgi:capsular exopolysaccharide synthesis family protein